MSSKKCEYRRCEYRRYMKYEPDYRGSYYEKDNCCCNFNTLVILILIILQFGKTDYQGEDKKDYQLIDNSILFIIALFFLSCCTRFR